jgi:rhodanese-related sulfurtransferase
MALQKSSRQLVEEASIKTAAINSADALGLLGRDDVLFVDIRDRAELKRDGMIPGAFHAPRGTLEFSVDPESPYFKPVFSVDRTYVLYCQSDLRAVLAEATLSDMGFKHIYHLVGGFNAWRKTGPVIQLEE